MTSLTILHLGRPASMGERHRVRTWVGLGERLGLEVRTIRLLAPDMATNRRRWPTPAQVGSVAVGHSPVETLAWSARAAREALATASPDLVLAITNRAFDRSLLGSGGHFVLDYVDRLSRSYNDRSTIVGRDSARGLAFRLLSWQHRRSERSAAAPTVAAGWRDASELGARWVPITVDVPAPTAAASEPRHDLLFFGNLSYPPNVDAVERLELILTQHLATRQLSVLVAGARPDARVEQVVARQGWSLVRDFDALQELLPQARMAVVPLRFAAGIQIKVLEAASFGLPQVLSAAAARGLDPAFPAEVAATDEEFAAGVQRLLDDPPAAARHGTAAREHIKEHYSTESWLPQVAELFGVRR